MNDKEMTMNIILSKKALLNGGLCIIPLIILFFINCLYFNNYLLFIFIFIVVGAFFIFSNKIMERKYSEKITIRLDYDHWIFIVNKNDAEEKYKLSDIKSYWMVDASTGYSSGLSFKFKISNPRKIYFAFFNKKLSVDQTDTEDMLNSFQSMIKDYNKTVADIDEQINLSQTFVESVYGLISIYVLSGLIILAVIFHIIYHQIGTLPISLLLGGGILLRIVAMRKSNIKRCNVFVNKE